MCCSEWLGDTFGKSAISRSGFSPKVSFGDIIHADGGGRDLRNHLLAQRTPDTFWEIDWLYRGIEA